MKKLLILSLVIFSFPLFCTKTKAQKKFAKTFAMVATEAQYNHDTQVVPAVVKKCTYIQPAAKKLSKTEKKGPFICSQCCAVYNKDDSKKPLTCDVCNLPLQPMLSTEQLIVIPTSTEKQKNAQQARVKHAIKMLEQRSALTQRRNDLLNQRIADIKRLQQQQAATLALLKAQLIEPKKQETTPAASSWFSIPNPLNVFWSSSAQPMTAAATAPVIEKRKQQRTFYNGDGTVAKLQVNEEKK